MQLNRSSNLFFDIPVNPNWGAGWYLDHAVVFHKDVLDVNSNVVVRIRIPKNLRTSLGIVSFIDDLWSWMFVQRTISVSCLGGNINKNIRVAKCFVSRHRFLLEPTHHQQSYRRSKLAWGDCHSMVMHSLMPWPILYHKQLLRSEKQHYYCCPPVLHSPPEGLLLEQRANQQVQLSHFQCACQCLRAFHQHHLLHGWWRFHLATMSIGIETQVTSSVPGALPSLGMAATWPALTDLEFKVATFLHCPPRL